MTTFLNLPVHHPTTTLAGCAKVISVHDKRLCRVRYNLLLTILRKHKWQHFYFTVHRGMPK